MFIIIGAALAAGIIGAFGPFVLARLPEPAEPAADKKLYSDLAKTPRLSLWLGLAAAIAAGVVASRIEPRALIPVWVVMAGVGAWLAFIDWHTRLLPWFIVAPFNVVLLLLVVLGAAIEGDWSILTRGLIAAAAVYALFRLSYHLIARSVGYGDVTISGGLGLALGTIGGMETVWGLWLGFALGAICSMVLALLKVVDAKAFAFGPYLILGTLLGAVWSPAIF
ncbi:MAG: prepilin peptidase [Actinomycetota bacterium]|nr:prepilin peptidase [Actinomycetota bacterium]